MYTWQHGFWIYFFLRSHPQVWQFVAGSMAPDYVYLVLLGILLIEGKLAPAEVLSISPYAMMVHISLRPWVIAIDLIGHSAVIWAGFLLSSLLPPLRWMRAFVVGWGTHILLDAFTHGAYANYWLYPFSMHTVIGPVSFWETSFHAREFRLVNGALMIMATVYLVWQKFKTKK